MGLGDQLLRQAPRLILGLIAVPVAAGVLGTLGPAFGIDTADPTPDLNQFRALAAAPGLGASIRLSLVTGGASTLIALLIATLAVAALQGSRAFALLRRLLSPLLSVPHAAAALGLAFLLAPSGWIARALSPWATGWQQPPDLLILNDPWGLCLTFGLITKETPFLLLMLLAALPQADAPRRHLVAQALGHGSCSGFLLAVYPALYRQMRLPVMAVLAYAMTVVDMAMILGPGLPPTLAQRITQWMTDPDLAHRGLAAAGAVLQLALVGLALGAWRLAEGLVAALARHLALSGWRGRRLDAVARPVALLLGAIPAGALLAGLAGMALWSVAGPWPFPDSLPQRLSLAIWQDQGAALWQTSLTSLGLALVAAGLALALVLVQLQAEHRFGPAPAAASALLYAPLLVPQVAFLPGLQLILLAIGLDGNAPAVALAHLIFVLPYVSLSLGPAWRAWDLRIATTGASLGAPPGRVFWRLRLPMLLRPVLTAAAIGLAVSLGQYLPTLLVGAGRVETLTTEAVALASGGNRRLAGAATLLQMALPALGFALALMVPALAFRHRRGMEPPR